MRLLGLSENGHGFMDKVNARSIEGVSKKKGQDRVNAAPVS